MRILHLCNTLSNRGNGIINVAVDLAIEQQRAGHTVAVMAGDGGYAELLKSEGVLVLELDQSRRKIPDLALASLRSRRLLREFRPDVVHAHMLTGMILCLPWTRLYRIPLIAHLHNVHDRAARRMGLADLVIAVSAAVADDMREQGIPPGKLRVVLNGNLQSHRTTDLSILTPADVMRPSIVTIAGMNHRKGIAELLEAFDVVAEQVPEVHLYLAGEGPERVLFEEQADRSAHRDRIHFIGFQTAPYRLLLASDVFVLASRRDSGPLVLIEARAAGCAIVASDVDGIPEHLDHGRAGVLVPPQSPAALAEAILPLLRDETLRREWQMKAKVGLERFSVKRVSDEVVGLYGELIARRQPRESGAAHRVDLSSDSLIDKDQNAPEKRSHALSEDL